MLMLPSYVKLLVLSTVALTRNQIELISDGNQNISVMIGTLLHVFGSRKRHSELTEEMHTPLRLKLFVLDASISWGTNRNWQTKVLDPFETDTKGRHSSWWTFL